MRITIELNTGTSLDAVALQQMLAWAQKIDVVPMVGETIASVSVMPEVSVHVEVPPPSKVAETVTEDDAETDTETEEQPPAGAVPPGVQAPATVRRRGRPSNAEKAAAEAAAKAAAEAPPPAAPTPVAAHQGNGAVPPGAVPPGATAPQAQPSGAVPPGAVPPAVTQAPIPAAMPAAAAPATNGGATLEDMREVYRQVMTTKPTGAFGLMKGTTWPDGSEKPKWYTIENVPSTHYDRLIAELSAL